MLNVLTTKIGALEAVELLQPLPIAKWKWDHVTMDFVIGLSRTQQKKDSIWVIVDRLTKSAHFLAMRVTNSILALSKLYMKEIVRLHGVTTLYCFI